MQYKRYTITTTRIPALVPPDLIGIDYVNADEFRGFPPGTLCVFEYMITNGENDTFDIIYKVAHDPTGEWIALREDKGELDSFIKDKAEFSFFGDAKMVELLACRGWNKPAEVYS